MGETGMSFGGLRTRLVLGLSLIFVGLAACLIPWTLNLVRTHFEYSHQELNRDVARAVVEHAELFHDGVAMPEELQGVFMKLMAVNPTLELYLLDEQGTILGFDAPKEAVLLDRVSLDPIEEFLAQPGKAVHGQDPKQPDATRTFTAWPVVENGQTMGYVYAVLRNEAFLDAAQPLDASILGPARWVLLGVLILALLCSLAIVAYFTRGFDDIQSTMTAFEQGDLDARCTPRGTDEVSRLADGFNFLAQNVQEQMEQVREGDRKRREMVASISHDLRTPLTSLQGYLEHLSDKWPELNDDSRNEILTIARRNADRVQRMTEDLLELSRLESGVVKLMVERFPIGELVHDLVQRFRQQAEAKGVELVASVPEGLPMVKADISLMERAIGNLVANALRHTPEGGKVTLRVLEMEHQLEIRVVDNGEGIAAEELPKIFERFYRVAKNRDVQKGSTGLGLAIVEQILKLHHATIQVRSKPDVGTVFRFRLSAA
ncbi:MAG: hypothetical protein COA70_00850 [Planctomycetota bacterium]|nr:MAG: hypothetical protein COA70_00850 [Planctomycetota bacterium]